MLFWYAPADGPPGVYGVPVEGASPAFVAAREKLRDLIELQDFEV